MYASGVAVHEAGHAVAGIVLGFEVDYVAIRADGSGVCVRRHTGSEERSAPTRNVPSSPGESYVETRATRLDAVREDPSWFEELLALIRREASSPERIADHLVFSRAARVAHGMLVSEKVALAYAADDLLSEDILLCALDDPRRMARIDHRTRARADEIVREHWDAICEVAARLTTEGRLDGEEVRRIVEEYASPGVGVRPSRPPGSPGSGAARG